MKNFDYLLMEESSGEAIAVDSGWETGPVVRVAQEGKMKVRYVVATHGHFDHVETLAELAGKLGAKTVAHESSELATDLRVRGGDTLALGTSVVKIIHTPGHTPDSICLFDGRNLFTGDTLFIGNCGRTDLPGGSTERALQEPSHCAAGPAARDANLSGSRLWGSAEQNDGGGGEVEPDARGQEPEGVRRSRVGLAEPLLEGLVLGGLRALEALRGGVDPLGRERVFVDQEGPDLVELEIAPDRPDSPVCGGREEEPPDRRVVNLVKLFLERLYLLERTVGPEVLECARWSDPLEAIRVEVGPDQDAEVDELLARDLEVAAESPAD